MYAEQRHKQILDQLNATGRVAVSDLADGFAVTTETIRRDLDALAAQSLLLRVHGGAVARRTAVVEPDMGTRSHTNLAQKNRIAEAAAQFLAQRNVGSIALDAGSTTSLIVSRLPAHAGPILTHDPAIAVTAVQAGFATHILPGQLRKITLAAVGAGTVAALAQLHPEIAILGTNGMGEQGFDTPDIEEAAVKTAMAKAASFRIVVADSSKAGVATLRTFATLDDIDLLITDTDIPTHYVTLFEHNGIEVIRA